MVDGLRIDHPDGLADPSGYLRRCAVATGGAWVVVEKVLVGDESLCADWQCAGTTGYDALRRIGALFVDPAGAPVLRAAFAGLAGADQGWAQWSSGPARRAGDPARRRGDRLVRVRAGCATATCGCATTRCAG